MTPIRSRPERLWVGMMLAAVGGFLDAYTYVRHGVFATAQTGNVVLLAVDAAGGRWHQILDRLPPILAFLAGVAYAETVARPAVRRRLRRPTRVVLIGEIAVLLLVGALPARTPSLLLTTAISFVAALQICTFNLLGDTAYNTTMVTGNLRTMFAAVHHWIFDRDNVAARQAVALGAVVLTFVFGAVASALLTTAWGKWAIWVAAGLLVVVLLGLILETRTIERTAAGR